MLDPFTAIYAFLGGVGLVGADAYMNSSTIHIETIVAPTYVEEGFEPRLVEALFLAELDNIIDVKSMIPSPHMVSSRDEPMSTAVAEAVGMSHALEAAKSTLGAMHPSLMLSILSEEQDGKKIERIVVAGDNSSEHHISVSIPLGGRPLDAALKEAAFETMKEIDPYATALHVFEVAENDNRQPLEAVALLSEAMEKENRDLFNPDRARLENLMGLTQLLLNNPQEADAWFEKSAKSDSSFSVAILNKAFVAAVNNDCEGAIARARPLLASTYWIFSPDEAITYPAKNLLGVCSSHLNHFADAQDYFADAADENPDGTSVYFYWARALAKEGRKQDAKDMMEIARRNVSRMDNVPEIAMLHFWINADGTTKFQKRKRVLPELESRG